MRVIRKAYDIDRLNIARDHPDFARDLERLGKAWLGLKKYNRARGYFESALAIDLKRYKSNHNVIAGDYRNFGLAWMGMGRLETALKNVERSLQIYTKIFNDDHPSVADTRQLLETINDRLN